MLHVSAHIYDYLDPQCHAIRPWALWAHKEQGCALTMAPPVGVQSHSLRRPPRYVCSPLQHQAPLVIRKHSQCTSSFHTKQFRCADIDTYLELLLHGRKGAVAPALCTRRFRQAVEDDSTSLAAHRLLLLEDLKPFWRAVSANKTLTDLNLAGLCLGVTGLRPVIDVLRQKGLPRLRILRLGRNNITSTGAVSIMDALVHCQSCTWLDLSYNEITATGVDTFAQLLPSAASLGVCTVWVWLRRRACVWCVLSSAFGKD